MPTSIKSFWYEKPNAHERVMQPEGKQRLEAPAPLSYHFKRAALHSLNIAVIIGGAMTLPLLTEIPLIFFTASFAGLCIINHHRHKAYNNTNRNTYQTPPEAITSLIKKLMNRTGLKKRPPTVLISSSVFDAHIMVYPNQNKIIINRVFLENTSSDEMEAALAHEIGHLALTNKFAQIAHKTIPSANMSLLLFGVTSLLTLNFTGSAIMIGAAYMSKALEMALYRQEEYRADIIAATISDKPDSLINTLANFFSMSTPANSGLLNKGLNALSKLYETHPDTNKRIHNITRTINNHRNNV